MDINATSDKAQVDIHKHDNKFEIKGNQHDVGDYNDQSRKKMIDNNEKHLKHIKTLETDIREMKVKMKEMDIK